MAPEVCLGLHDWGYGVGSNVRKSKDGYSSRVDECNVNPRAEMVIFLFLVTRKCTERQIEERLDREQFRERDTWAETLRVAGRGKRRSRKSQTPSKQETQERRQD